MLARRVKAEVLEEYRAGLHQAEVPDAGWDTSAEVQGAEADVDALIASATQQKARLSSATGLLHVWQRVPFSLKLALASRHSCAVDPLDN